MLDIAMQEQVLIICMSALMALHLPTIVHAKGTGAVILCGAQMDRWLVMMLHRPPLTRILGVRMIVVNTAE